MRRIWLSLLLACTPAVHAGDSPVKPVAELYADYNPVFAESQPGPLMKLSQQPTFFNRSSVYINNQAKALIEEGIKQEAAGDFRAAATHYIKVVDKYSDSFLQVGAAGVFVPALLCAQQRLLRFPAKELAFYRLNNDPHARELYQGASENHSQEGLQEIVVFFAATSYGAKALFDLGSIALDAGECERAAECFQQILNWYPPADYDAWEVNYRLAFAARRRGHEHTFQNAFTALSDDTPLHKQKRDGLAGIPSRVMASEKNDSWPCISFSNYAPRTNLLTPLTGNASQWHVNLPKAPWPTAEDVDSGGELRPFHMPWVVGNNIYLKHYNRIYCHSPIDGRLKWAFELPPVDRDDRRIFSEFWCSGRWSTNWYSQQDIVIDEDLLFANVRAYGDRESMIALDRVTGEMRWAIGSISPHDESDMQTRYDALPAVGHTAVFLPWSCDIGESGSHIATAVGLTAFDKHTGRMLWKKELCQLQPTATTQHRSGINIYSSQPLIHEGIVYHSTNAGTIAAVDEISGTVRWMVRYPHLWRPQSDSGNYFADPVDAHDDAPNSHGKPYWTPFFCNQVPLLRDGRLYLTPVDSEQLLCLDAGTGKVIWSAIPPHAKGCPVTSQYVNAAMIGVTSQGELALSGQDLVLYDLKSGKTTWSFTPTFHSTWSRPNPAWHVGADYPMMTLGRPTMTNDGHISLSAYYPHWEYGMGGYYVAYGEWNVSLPERKTVEQRVYFNPHFRQVIEGILKGAVKDSKAHAEFEKMSGPADVNAPFPYDPVKRLPFLFHGVPFEIRDLGQSLHAVFDLQALSAAIEKGATHLELQTQAEILLSKGLEEQALATFEKCRAFVGPENHDFVREIDRDIFRLCRIRAWKALLAGDTQLFHKYAVRMSQTATTIGEELDANFALAESFERRGNVQRAVQCLQNILRHYPATTVAAQSASIDESSDENSALAGCVAVVGRNKPTAFHHEFVGIEEFSKKSLPAFQSVTAPVQRHIKLDAVTLAAGKLRGLIARHPEFSAEFDRLAQSALHDASTERLELEIRCFPATAAAQKTFDQFVQTAQTLQPVERQRRLWKFTDETALLGLSLSSEIAAQNKLVPAEQPSFEAPKALTEKNSKIEDGAQNLRLLLTERCPSLRNSNLVFIGGRSKRRLDNKFSLECWDVEQWKEKFAVKDIGLKGKGEEPGFEEALSGETDVVVHGKFDIFSFELQKGDLLWRFRLPFDFDLQAVDRIGGLIVASGSVQTLALQASTGQVIWEARDEGTLYHAPYFADGKIISVRREPYGVVFRALVSGRLERILEMPELSNVTRHPVLAPDVTQSMIGDSTATAGLPIDGHGDLLMLTDGSSYIAVDMKRMSVRWKREIDNNDPLPGPLRFYVHEPHVLVLKRDHGTPMLHLLDSATGQLKWTAPPKDTVYSIAFDDHGDSFVGLATPDAGRIGAELRCFEMLSRKERWSWTWSGFSKRPDVEIETVTSDGCVILRDLCGDEFGMAIFDPSKKELSSRIKTQGVGGWREHGGKSSLMGAGTLILLKEGQLAAAVGR